MVEMMPVSDILKDLLARQAMRSDGAGTPELHVMGWAHALLDREEGGADALHAPAGGEEGRRMGMGKGPDAEAPGQLTGEDMPLLLRVVSSRRGAARRTTGAAPRLVLVVNNRSAHG